MSVLQVAHRQVRIDKHSSLSIGLFYSLWNQGPGSHTKNMGYHLQDYYQGGERCERRPSKNTGKLPAIFRLPLSWFKIFLVAANLWLFSRVLTASAWFFGCFCGRTSPWSYLLHSLIFTFRSVIYMEFILAYSIKYGFNFHQMTIQLSQLHLLKSLSFLQYFEMLTSSISRFSILFDWSLSSHASILYCGYYRMF